MTTVVRCTCCDLPVDGCGLDAERRQAAAERQRRTDLTVRGYWSAAYPGTCSTCGDPFQPGTLVARTRGGLQAECCA